VLIVWYLSSVPNSVQISVVVTEIDALMLRFVRAGRVIYQVSSQKRAVPFCMCDLSLLHHVLNWTVFLRWYNSRTQSFGTQAFNTTKHYVGLARALEQLLIRQVYNNQCRNNKHTHTGFMYRDKYLQIPTLPNTRWCRDSNLLNEWRRYPLGYHASHVL